MISHADDRSWPAETCDIAVIPAVSGSRHCSGGVVLRRMRWMVDSQPGRQRAMQVIEDIDVSIGRRQRNETEQGIDGQDGSGSKAEHH